MDDKKEQVKPLAPRAAYQIDIDHKPNTSRAKSITQSDHKCIKCCGCSAAILLILVMILLILVFTVCHIKDPVVKMNSVEIKGLDLLNSNREFPRGINLTLLAEVSVRNPNAASFRFDKTTTTVYYNDSIVGEVSTPAGRVAARWTLGMNVTVDVMVDKILEINGRFKSDLIGGNFHLSTYTRISGKVNIMDVFKRSVVVKMKCTMNVNANGQIIQDRNCRRGVSV